MLYTGLGIFTGNIHIQQHFNQPEKYQKYQNRNHTGCNQHHGHCFHKMIQGILHLLYQFFRRNGHIFHRCCHRILRTGKGILCFVKDAGDSCFLLRCILICALLRLFHLLLRGAAVFQHFLRTLCVLQCRIDLGLISGLDKI